MNAALARVELDASPENLEAALTACVAAPLPAPGCMAAAYRLEEFHSEDEDPLKLTWARSFRAGFLYSGGEETEALTLLEQIVETRREFFGGSSPEVAESLNWLGNMRLKGGKDPEGAAEAFSSALEIWEERNGPESTEVAKASLNLAVAEGALTHFDRSVELMQKSLTAMEAALGADHPFVAIVLDQLASEETLLGRFSDAMVHSRRALDLAEKSHGNDSLQWAQTLHNRCWLLMRMGEFPSAVPGLERSWGIFRREYGDSDVRTVTVGENLAEAQMGLGNLDAAAETIDQVIVGAREAGNPGILALGLIIRGNLDLRLGAPHAAGPTFDEAYELLTSNVGAGHPWCITALEGRARAALIENEVPRAAPLIGESLSISRKVYGNRHPATAENLALQAEVLRRLGRVDGALEAALEAERIGREHLAMALPVVDERLALTLAENRVMGVDRGMQMAESLSDEQVRLVWDQVVRSRAVVFDEMARRRRRLRNSASPEAAMLGRDFDRARRKLAERIVYSIATGGEGPGADELERAFGHIEALEHRLAAAGKADHPLRQEIGLNDVVAALDSNSALVAYVRIGRSGPGAIPTEVDPAYVALVRRTDGAVRALHLGSAISVDTAVEDWRQAFESRTLDRAADEARLRLRGETLRTLVWDPVEAEVDDATTVIIVPDGTLHLVNLEALPSKGDRYLIEDGPAIRRISAERDVIRPPGRHAPTTGGILFACGEPRFGPSGRATSRSRQDADDLVFGPLPGARKEVETIEELWRRQRPSAERRILIGEAATEARFSSLIQGAETIHIATHTFFLGHDARRRDRLREMPLLRSGLALAGAAGAVGRDGGDGLLTALEISALDLEQAQWVTLSACGSGLGDVQQGEGVLGLERAFGIAGARTLVVSLWPVGDDETRSWMDRFYSYGLAGIPAAEAARRTSMDILGERRAEGRSTHPASWGAFVVSGG